MPTTYTAIASTTLTASVASVTLSSIPQTFTDLVVQISARTDRPSILGQELRLRFNGSSASNYSNTSLTGDGNSASTSIQSPTSFIAQIRQNTASDATASTFGSIEIYIPNYTTSFKQVLFSFGAGESNNATNVLLGINAGLWQLTEAVTSIVFILPANDFVSGSTFHLYGIKNS